MKIYNNHAVVDKIGDSAFTIGSSIYPAMPRAKRIGIEIGEKRYLTAGLGNGTTSPMVNELVEKMRPTTDRGGYDVFKVNASNQSPDDAYDNANTSNSPFPDKIARSIEAAKCLTLNFTKDRQYITFDSVSYNSHGQILFGNAMDYKSVPLYNRTGDGFGWIVSQLSTYNLQRLSRERAVVAYDEHGAIALAVNLDYINNNFRGLIEFELYSTSSGLEDVVSKQTLMITDEVSGIKKITMSEAPFVDTVISGGDAAEYVEISKSMHDGVVSGSFRKDDTILINKTNRLCSVLLDSGISVKLNPFGIVNLGNDDVSVESVTLMHYVFVRPSRVNGFEGGVLFDSTVESPTMIGKSFVRNCKDFYYIDGGELKKTTIGISGFSCFYSYLIDKIDLSSASVEELGDTGIYYVSNGGYDAYVKDGDLYVKRTSELSFTKLDFAESDGWYTASYSGLSAKRPSYIPEGFVLKSEEFMYESNFIIGKGGEISEIICSAYPTKFFRVTPKSQGCSNNRPLNDTYNNAKNEYAAYEIRHVSKIADGVLGVDNAAFPSENAIHYGYMHTLGRYSDEPFVIESFGVVSHDTAGPITGNHFLATKYIEHEDSLVAKKIMGIEDKKYSKYECVWVAMRHLGTDKIVFIADVEFDDEYAPHTKHHRYMNQGRDCQTPVTEPESWIEYETDMLHYHAFCSSSENRSIAQGGFSPFKFKVSKAVGEYHMGVSGEIDTSSATKYNGFGVTALSVQGVSSFKDVMFLGQNDYKRVSWGDNLFDYSNGSSSEKIDLVAMPDIGLFMVVSGDQVIPNIDSFEEEIIKEPFKRGVRRVLIDGSAFEAFLAYDGTTTKAVYRYVDDNGAEKNREELPYPSGISTIAVEAGQYSVCVPKKLANYLYGTYSFSQIVFALWDESSGVTIDDRRFDIKEAVMSSGFKIYAEIDGIEPIDYTDIYAMINVRDLRIPYDMSDDTILRLERQGVIQTYDDALYNSDDEDDAVRRKNLMQSLCYGVSGKKVVSAVPVWHQNNGPWTPFSDNTYPEEKILAWRHIKYTVRKGRRATIEFNVGLSNKLSLSHDGRLFSDVYTYIDGYIQREIVLDRKETPTQKGQHSYVVEYINHSGGEKFLKRKIIVDIDRHPGFVSYLRNNLTRELISPVWENAHQLKMDARAVFSRFDTRYVSESIHSYYDKFIEIPTAFTCDSLPEESMFTRGTTRIDRLYSNKMSVVSGRDIANIGGSIVLSFDNDTDEDIEVNMVFDNTFISGKSSTGEVSSYDISDVDSAIRGSMALYGRETVLSGRARYGQYFVGTVEGELQW